MDRQKALGLSKASHRPTLETIVREIGDNQNNVLGRQQKEVNNL